MSTTDRSTRVTVIAALLGSLLAGCAGTTANRPTATKVPPPDAPLGTSDPCALRLHDVCGALLFYYATQRRLPEHATDLIGLPGVATPDQLVCPLSHRPYVYNPDGLPAPEQGTRIILYDAAPAHNGYRWAITLADTAPGSPLITKVIAIPEARFIQQQPPGR